MLPEYIDRLLYYNVNHVTITINCIDPKIGAAIYPWIIWQGQKLKGEAAASKLIEQQQIGLDMLVKAGVLVKINSVLIPGINDKHIVEISKTIKSKGAFLHNVLPLIAKPEHGTHFGLISQAEPSTEELQQVQSACSKHTKVMRHCRQCRADAIGLLNEDRSAEFSLKATEPDTKTETITSADPVELNAYTSAKRKSPHNENKSVMRIAVASNDGVHIDRHFGQADSFLIYDVSPKQAVLNEHRYVKSGCKGENSCEGGSKSLTKTTEMLSDCAAVLCAGIGYEPWRMLQKLGVAPNGEYAMRRIDHVIAEVYRELVTGKIPVTSAKKCINQS
jgi:nitrogen fixation protein NifB